MIHFADDFFYITNSLRKMDIVYCLSMINFGRKSEISSIMLIPEQSTYSILKNLEKRDIVGIKKISGTNIYFLTKKGRIIADQLKEYHGIK